MGVENKLKKFRWSENFLKSKIRKKQRMPFYRENPVVNLKK